MKKRICYGCMSELDEDTKFCTRCGFNEEQYLKTHNPVALLPGTILNDRYMLGKVLGKGGFGITYIGLDMKLDIKVAIKEYFPSAYATRTVTSVDNTTSQVVANYGSEEYQSGLEQFLQEAKTIAQFNKVQGIVSVTDHFEQNKTGYYVMEFLQGESLKHMVDTRDTPMKQEEVIRILKPVILALRKVHQAGIVHRDISPDNMVFDENHNLTLIDFGAAKKSNMIEAGGSIQLKHGYAPIEQYYLEGELGPWTDVYALCATIYYVMSHAKPIRADQRVQENTHLLTLEELGLATKDFSDVVNQGLALDFHHRFKTLDALVKAFYEDVSTSVTPLPTPPLPTQQPRYETLSDGTVVYIDEWGRRTVVKRPAKKESHTFGVTLVIALSIVCIILSLFVLYIYMQ